MQWLIICSDVVNNAIDPLKGCDFAWACFTHRVPAAAQHSAVVLLVALEHLHCLLC